MSGSDGHILNVDTITLINLCRKHNAQIMETLRALQESNRKSDVAELLETMERTSHILLRCVKEYGDLKSLRLKLVEVVYKQLCKYEKEVARLHKRGALARFVTQVRLRSKIDQLSNSILEAAVNLEAELKDAIYDEGVKEYDRDFQAIMPAVISREPMDPYAPPTHAPRLIDDVVQDPNTLMRLENYFSVLKDDDKRSELFESISSFPVKPLTDIKEVFVLAPERTNDEQLHEAEGGAAGMSLSSYPMATEPDRAGLRDGDPICDQYYGTFFSRRSLVALADGCNWGEEPKEAARKAARMFAAYMKRHQHRIASTKDASVLLLRAFWAAHGVIVDGRTEETIWQTGTTTMIAAVVLELAKPSDNKTYALVLASVGDCKAYCFHARTKKWDEITKFNRGGVDARDPGGRLGPTLDDTGPDLRNLIMYNYLLEEGDLVIFVSDGVHDNMDPKNQGLTPRECGLDSQSDKWDDVADKVLQEQKIMEYTLNKLTELCPDPTVGSVVRTLCDHALEVTYPTRHFMETHTGERVPDDYRKYPGKLDHTTCVAFKVGGFSHAGSAGASDAAHDPVPHPVVVPVARPQVVSEPVRVESGSNYGTLLSPEDMQALNGSGGRIDVLENSMQLRTDFNRAGDEYDALPSINPAPAAAEQPQHTHAFAVWSRLFGSESFIVKWPVFIDTLRTALRDGMPPARTKLSRSNSRLDDNNDSPRQIEALLDAFPGGQMLNEDDDDRLRQVIDNSGAGTVTRFRFFEFLGGFGPLPSMLNNLRTITSAQWFYGFISSSEAKRFLESHPIGTFLVRFSGTQPGSFVLDYVRDVGHVRSVRLRSSGGPQGGLSALTEGSATKERVFENLHSLVETYTKMNILRLPFTSTLPNKPWFFGDVTREEAQALLQGQPPGTFLVRFSDRAGCFAASFVHSDGEVKKGLITQHADGHQVHGKGKVFANLDELVEHYYVQKIFTKPLGNPGQ